MHGRQLPERDYLRIKEATGALIDLLKGPKRAAEATRVGAPQLSRATDRWDGHFAAIDVIADLESEAGEPVVTRVLAELSGFDLVPRERPAEVGVARLTQHLGEVGAAAGATLAALADALRDGRVTRGELERILDTARVAQREHAELIADAEAAMAGRPEGLRVVGGA